MRRSHRRCQWMVRPEFRWNFLQLCRGEGSPVCCLLLLKKRLSSGISRQIKSHDKTENQLLRSSSSAGFRGLSYVSENFVLAMLPFIGGSWFRRTAVVWSEGILGSASSFLLLDLDRPEQPNFSVAQNEPYLSRLPFEVSWLPNCEAKFGCHSCVHLSMLVCWRAGAHRRGKASLLTLLVNWCAFYPPAVGIRLIRAGGFMEHKNPSGLITTCAALHFLVLCKDVCGYLRKKNVIKRICI